MRLPCGISTRGTLQRDLLQAEGVPFRADDTLDLAAYRWRGPDAAWATAHGFEVLPPPAPASSPAPLVEQPPLL